MQSPDEIFDVVDEQDRVTGHAPRAEVHAQGLRHRAVHVLILNSQHELLLQKRSATKDTFPGCLDSSASGHLNRGEDYDAAALREVHEELGLSLHPTQLHRQFQIPAGPETGWEFVWVYTVHGDYRLQPNPAEVASVEAVSIRDLHTRLAKQPERYARSFHRVFREAVARGILPA